MAEEKKAKFRALKDIQVDKETWVKAGEIVEAPEGFKSFAGSGKDGSDPKSAVERIEESEASNG